MHCKVAKQEPASFLAGFFCWNIDVTLAPWVMLKPMAHHQLPNDAQSWRNALVAWFEQVGLDLPWRRSRNPYEILVSEVMLQQTQLKVVLQRQFYSRFLQAFPTVESLAAASEQELLKAWEGLGYYRRVRQLQATARLVLERHGGQFPADASALAALPGLGPYTVGALLSFAFEHPAALVDGNVLRVFARLFDDATSIDSASGIKMAWQRAELLLDRQRPRLYNSALMELGQRVCTVGVPRCVECPVASFCRSSQPQLLPVKSKTVKQTELLEAAVLVQSSAGRLLCVQERGARRTGMWRFPLIEELPSLPKHWLFTHDYSITRYRVHLQVYECVDLQEESGLCEGAEWRSPAELIAMPMAAPYRKVLQRWRSSPNGI